MSSAQTQAQEDAVPENEWTIMIFFAGDPHLSPSMTAQLKALKDAGFQDNTTVLVHYDPNEKGVATTTFEINRKRKADLRTQLKNNHENKPATRIGDGKDPFVRNLLEDSINGASRTDNAEQALRAFLEIGATRYPATKHYIVCLVGHGVIVGNDAFLPDHQPESAITLEQLGDTMRHFKGRIPKGAVVELIGMHSCSMSAVEVLYELKGAARYMMATEGVSFVASWPYRQLLKKILNAIAETKPDGEQRKVETELDVDKLITSLHGLSLHNSTDFMFSGLSADLSLCRLDEDPIDELTLLLEDLTKALKAGLSDERGLELIRLAHLEAQSYWQEVYTDLYDFCLCLERQCDQDNIVQKAMADACRAVRYKLEESTEPGSLIVQSDHFGPLFQYSHGLSIFFPWSRPIADEPVIVDDDILTRYENYEFTKALGADSWLSFLEEYFTKTKRKSREDEDKTRNAKVPTISDNGTNFRATAAAIGIGTSTIGSVEALAPEKASGALEKASGALTDSMGCSCSVKNYPREFSQSPRAAQDPNPEATWRSSTRPDSVPATSS